MNLSQFSGQNVLSLDGRKKVTGQAQYAADYSMKDMLHVAVVRSTQPHATILSLDFQTVSTECTCFSATDLACNVIEDVVEDQPIFADKKVRFFGEALALIVADSCDIAHREAKKVKVDYQNLPIVDSARQALENIVLVHENGNLVSSFVNEKGDVSAAFATSDLILEDVFFAPVQDHAFLEPEACLAYMDNEVLTVIVSSQNVFHDQRMICRALGLQKEQVRVINAFVGGGFGGKDGHTNQIFAALVAWKTGKPAKIVFSREESLISTYKRHAAEVHAKIGFSKNGKILAFEGRGYLDTGAYTGYGLGVMAVFCEHFAGPYEIPNVAISAQLIYTNKAPAHAMRGFGAPQGAFATETLISRAADLLKIDPLKIRLQNAVAYGSIGAIGQIHESSVGLREALIMVRESHLWRSRKENTDPTVGYGVALGHMSCGMGKGIPDSAEVLLERLADDQYRLCIGIADIGQGNKTVFAQIVADALNTKIENIHIILADTTLTRDCGSTAASRTLVIVGNAILNAAQNMKSKNSTFAIGRADFPEAQEGLCKNVTAHVMYSYIAQAVKLRVDPATGSIEILDIYSALDAGKILNPLQMCGQVQGGTCMSVGMTFGEDMRYQNGYPQHTSFETYLLPTAVDICEIVSETVSGIAEDKGPYGAKGAAEVPTIAIAPAIISAAEQVCGAKFSVLPLEKESVLFAVMAKQSNTGACHIVGKDKATI